ncbi:HPP family protein [Haloarchaeobius sp. HME9146]|uniref:HPP family protein n=1 Tax=Haloarchaeobius sp. HME9146 TaxID=2978732 RepID=UPI0021BE8545|nr:HPP family protein [Haloarchaeobius sp. HME9146]MCT9095470.1 HPP family protein [Haloarchaeobius sp. HME9146]
MDHRQSLVAGGLFTVCGVVAWVTGLPFVFPSLGPTAFVLATAEDPGPRRIVGGHAIGAVVGFTANELVAPGLVATAQFAPFAPASARLAAAGALAVAGTTAGMRATGTVHPPACATTLILSLGLLGTLRAVGVVVAAVTLLYLTFRLATHVIDRHRGRTYPP